MFEKVNWRTQTHSKLRWLAVYIYEGLENGIPGATLSEVSAIVNINTVIRTDEGTKMGRELYKIVLKKGVKAG